MTKAEANHKLVPICLIYMYTFIPSLQDNLYNHFAMPLIFRRAFNLLLQSLRQSNAHTRVREWCNTLLCFFASSHFQVHYESIWMQINESILSRLLSSPPPLMSLYLPCGYSLRLGSFLFSSVQSLGCVCLFETPWTTARQASLSITNSWRLLKIMSIELVMPSNHLISVFPFSSSLQSFLASGSFPLSQFFTSGGQRLEFQLQHQSFQ